MLWGSSKSLSAVTHCIGFEKRELMMMKSLNIRLLENSEQSLILPLLGKSFPDYWEQLALSSGKMPYEEISFAAFDTDKVIGHCGVIPYRFCLMVFEIQR